MNPVFPRVALTNSAVCEQIRAASRGADWFVCQPNDLAAQIGKVDFFLLDDETAIRFLGGLPEDIWPSVVVFARDGDSVPAVYTQGLAEDLLVLPARSLDLERVLRHHETVRQLRALEESSHGVTGLVKQLQEDINMAQKIQRRLIREKFPALGPLSVKSKYWCGLKSGGDYFDLFEFPGNSHAGLILADSSSYALSTSLIGSLMQFSVHVGSQNLDRPGAVVEALLAKLRESMKEKDRLSLLFGILDRKTCVMRFVSSGSIYLAKLGRGGSVEWATRGDMPPLTLATASVPESHEVCLEPGDRLLLCSDGWGEALGESVPKLMEGWLSQKTDAQELMNQLAYSLRRKLEAESDEGAGSDDDFPMPPQDCSVLLLDLATSALRLAR